MLFILHHLFEKSPAAVLLFFIIFIAPMASNASEADVPPPPLGLEDAASILAWANQRLSEAGPTTVTLDVASSVGLHVQQVAAYLGEIVQTTLGRRPYQWLTIGRKRVSSGRLDTDEYRLGVPILGAGAVRFYAHGGDIYLQEMTIIQHSGASLHYDMNRWVYSELPKREVFYLSPALDVSIVVLKMRKKWQEPARMVLDVGVSEIPEYLRDSAGLCGRARERLREGNIAAAQSAMLAARDFLKAYVEDGR